MSNAAAVRAEVEKLTNQLNDLDDEIKTLQRKRMAKERELDDALHELNAILK